MRLLGSTVPERLTRAEIFLLGALTSIAVLVAIRSIESAVPGETMWPSFFLEQSRPFISIGTLIVVATVIGFYMVMRRRGFAHRAFWVVTLMIIGVHLTAVWAHNQLDWHHLFGRVAVFGAAEPLLLTASLFLISLAGLILLHRIMQLRDLADAFSARGVSNSERDGILINELASTALAIAFALVASTLTVVIGAVVGNSESLTQRLPWAVGVVGIGAVLVFAGFLVLLFRTLSGGETAERDQLSVNPPALTDSDSQ